VLVAPTAPLTPHAAKAVVVLRDADSAEVKRWWSRMGLGAEAVVIELRRIAQHPNSNFDFGNDGRHIPHLFSALRLVSFGKTSNRR
jgi:hypothetical protein